MSVTTATGRVEGQDMAPTSYAYRKYYLVSFWAESLIYGGYLFLFITAMSMLRKRRDWGTPSANFFLGCLIAMFVLITFHNFTNVYRMLHAFVTVPSRLPGPAEPVNYLRKCEANWDCFLFMVILACLNWIADILMIFRCYLVWGRNIRAIVLPCMIFVLIFGLRIFNWYFVFNYRKLPREPTFTIRGLSFPFSLALSVLTTGLIAYRIWSQHRRAVCAGFQTSSPGAPSLLLVTRIIVESAMIWTAHVLCITILYYLQNPAQIIVQHMSIPSIGIVFVLMAVRTHMAHVEARDAASSSVDAGSRAAFPALPAWLDADSRDAGYKHTKDGTANSRQLPTYPSAVHSDERRSRTSLERSERLKVAPFV